MFSTGKFAAAVNSVMVFNNTLQPLIAAACCSFLNATNSRIRPYSLTGQIVCGCDQRHTDARVSADSIAILTRVTTVPWGTNNKVRSRSEIQRTNESFDSPVETEDRKSTGVDGMTLSKPTTVPAPASVITTVNHPPSAAEAQELEVKANEVFEAGTE
jgi:hypothetical protein